jgi:hypothetical protein
MHVSATCLASDIVVVSARRRPGADVMHGYDAMRETVRASLASVLFLPQEAERARGPVVAVALGAADPSLAVARLIAGSWRERLVIVGSGDPAAIPIALGSGAHDIAIALGDIRERLIVMTRDKPGQGAELAATRGVPVLLVEPG